MPEGCEKMSKQGDAAYAWFLKGYNCSQSVVAAFAPQLGLTEETALRLSAGFGAGIGRMREVCGAFCGVVTVLSMVYADPTDPKDKSRMYALVQQAAEQYRNRNGGGSIICRPISLEYTCGSYTAARTVMDALHSSDYVNLISDVTLDLDAEHGTRVNLTITYFELQSTGSAS